ncbi:MAG: ABC transporter permease, partial [Longimicrobiales bacterium]
MSAGSSSEPPRGIARPPGTGARGGTKPGEAEPPRVGVPLPPVDRETAEPPGSRLIDWVARWVPVSRRDQWLAEWRAELSHASEGARSRGESERMTKWRMRRRALGGVRDARWLRGAYGVPSPGLSGLRDATRVLKRQPGFALMVVCTLALGIGAATAIFSVVDGLMLRPLPFRDPERLVQVFIGRGGDGTSVYVDADAARVWRGQDAVFSASHLLGWRSLMLTGPGEPRNLRAELVEPGLLGTLGTPPALGREFLPEEGVPGRDRVVMLSHELWRGAFAADATVIGATIYLDDEPHTVVGVMPSSVRVLPGGIPEIALPLTDPPPSPRGLMLLGRIRSDLSLPVAQARLDAVTARLEAAQPREAGWGVQLTPLERLLNEDTRRGLTALAGAVLLLLFVACVNAAGLLFVRGVTRNAELAIRRSLGASRAMLFRQSLGESLVLAGLAGVAGALLAWWGVHALLALVPEGLIRFSYNAVGINARVLVFAVALTFATGVAFGIGPALRASRTDALHTSRRTATASRAEARLRSVIQAVQLALAVMLLAGAGLFGRSFLRLAAVDPGFDPHDLLQLTYELPTFRYPNPPQRAAFNR